MHYGGRYTLQSLIAPLCYRQEYGAGRPHYRVDRVLRVHATVLRFLMISLRFYPIPINIVSFMA